MALDKKSEGPERSHCSRASVVPYENRQDSTGLIQGASPPWSIPDRFKRDATLTDEPATLAARFGRQCFEGDLRGPRLGGSGIFLSDLAERARRQPFVFHGRRPIRAVPEESVVVHGKKEPDLFQLLASLGGRREPQNPSGITGSMMRLRSFSSLS